MWLFSRKGASGFSASSTAEEVTRGIDGSGLTAIVTGRKLILGRSNVPEQTLPVRMASTRKKMGALLGTNEDLMRMLLLSIAGASSGIGAETTRVLALRRVHVVMGVRNMAAGRDAREAIVESIPSAKVDVMELDLSSMESVRKFASDFNSSGIMATPFMLSKDNIELQFATNHIGHFLLTDLLLETMKKTTNESRREGRIVIVSSDAHHYSYPEGIRFDRINDQSGYSSSWAYCQSKLANVLHANELTRRLKDDGAMITANSLHPGAIVSNLFRHMGIVKGLVDSVGRLFLKNIHQGAATTCYVALHPQVKGVSGEYFSDSNLAKASPRGRDPELAGKLWEFSMNLVK